MGATELIVKATVLSIVMTLFAVAWGFLMLKLQGSEE
ncbi:PetM family of cytochrome b6f complex subunit 7 [Rubidibacter lacunae KORDI 51-2]|uniref:PetM family of cytochrome b6f complex subunit 7 n=1 Tax=Rubidibacter lacunae KORDI 51-2 TaxID=582515 RepID=U5DKI7_9CHRO|nr:PetM family cytochrome b6-f complex subunit 7 [Rubidibacter lacunae]ERN42186.1 PetM family of cytochrome b6f complex subunit 7 [Rubidibacter lacunae KORDI 51-2]